jgi:hypothetical protein
MTYAGAIFLIAAGAILKYATNFDVRGVEIDTVGVILMIAGALGLLLGLFSDLIWTDRLRRRDAVARDPRVDDRV